MNKGFDPKEITIKVGSKVTWKNLSPTRASTISSTLGGFKSERLLPGESWSYTFEKTGTFKYVDAGNAQSSGIITVTQ